MFLEAPNLPPGALPDPTHVVINHLFCNMVRALALLQPGQTIRHCLPVLTAADQFGTGGLLHSLSSEASRYAGLCNYPSAR